MGKEKGFWLWWGCGAGLGRGDSKVKHNSLQTYTFMHGGAVQAQWACFMCCSTYYAVFEWGNKEQGYIPVPSSVDKNIGWQEEWTGAG